AGRGFLWRALSCAAILLLEGPGSRGSPREDEAPRLTAAGPLHRSGVLRLGRPAPDRSPAQAETATCCGVRCAPIFQRTPTRLVNAVKPRRRPAPGLLFAWPTAGGLISSRRPGAGKRSDPHCHSPARTVSACRLGRALLRGCASFAVCAGYSTRDD